MVTKFFNPRSMRKGFFLAIMILSGLYSRAQNNVNFAGLKFEQYDKIKDGTTILEFKSNTQATYIMSGTLPISGKSYRDVCPCKCKVTGTKVSITCLCPDKEIYPDPIEDNLSYDSKKKILSSTRYQYTTGSAPSADLAWKYIIWYPKQ